jgi:hypothetical protein
MPDPTNPQGPPEPDPELRARAARLLRGKRNDGVLGGRKPFDIYYDATGRPLTRQRMRSFMPEPLDGETRSELYERGGNRVLMNLSKLAGGMSSDAARVLQILQTSTINDLARVSPLGGSMTHAMNQVISETQYGLFTPHDRKASGQAMNNVAQIGEIIALSHAMQGGGGHIAPRGML